MSFTTMRRMWPSDRYQRFLDLRTRARKSGLSTTVGNHGPKGLPVFSMQFRNDKADLAKLFDIGEAEAWLDSYEVQVRDVVLGGRAE